MHLAKATEARLYLNEKKAEIKEIWRGDPRLLIKAVYKIINTDKYKDQCIIKTKESKGLN
jgi:hypothetical protein